MIGPRPIPALAVLCMLAGCGEEGDSGADTGCAFTYESVGAPFLTTYCRSCHGAAVKDRRGAPESVNFDTEADAARHLDAIRRTVLETGTMPIGGGVLPEDLVDLQRWLECAS